MLVSGDRESEVRYLAESVGITEVHAGKSPEEKVAIVREETAKAETLFVGDGINDAPALMAATVGVAFGSQNDITTEAADAVVLEAALAKIDELMHIGQRVRRIALQSALGGMAASMVGMVAAAFGFLPPIWGAVGQELIDLLAVLNAVRVGYRRTTCGISNRKNTSSDQQSVFSYGFEGGFVDGADCCVGGFCAGGCADFMISFRSE